MSPPEQTTPEFKRLTRFLAAWGALAVLALLAYANHFHNGFHYDDGHAVVDNPWIRNPGNALRFFMDGSTFSVYPPNQSYRPMITLSLAIDYWLSGSEEMRPEWFHISTFLWFLVQLGLMLVLFRSVPDRAPPSRGSFLTAFFATAIYAVHPAVADTVNYIIQRGDLYSALGVVAGLVAWIVAPGARRYGLYLIPVLFGLLSKPPTAVFPALLLLWIWLFEGAAFPEALRRSAPAIVFTGIVTWFTVRMTPKTFVTGSVSAKAYLIDQPWFLFRYFRQFFRPVHLIASGDYPPFHSLRNPFVLIGIAFLIGFIGLTLWCLRREETRPIAFGLAWFLIASAPTSLVPLAEVENSHRMFFPFIGLTLAVCAAVRLWAQRGGGGRQFAAVALGAMAIPGLLWATHERNRIWANEETFWRAALTTNPDFGAALSNYALQLIRRKDFTGAYPVLEHALRVMPDNYAVELNLAQIWGEWGNSQEASRHFVRAIQDGAQLAQPRYGIAAWLMKENRLDEAAEHLKFALRRHPDYQPAHALLLQTYALMGNYAALDAQAEETLRLFPNDPATLDVMSRAHEIAALRPTVPTPTAQSIVDKASTFMLVEKPAECVSAAEEALKLDAKFAPAWNASAACKGALSKWDEALHDADEAVRLDPTLASAVRVRDAARAAIARPR